MSMDMAKWMSTTSSSSGSTSFATIIATLIPTSITAITFVLIFIAIRLRYRIIYTPRTFIGTIPEQDRTPSSSIGASKWFHDFRALEDKFVLRHQSLDGYLFLRFFKLIILICVVGSCLTWPILFPVNITGGGDATQLDKLTFSNIDDNKRLYAHAVVAWLFLGFVILAVTRETLFLLGTRRAYFSSKASASRLSSRVVLFLFAPREALKTDRLRATFGNEAEKSWVVSDYGDLGDLAQKRDDCAFTLEAAEISLSKKGSQRYYAKKGRSSNQDSENNETNGGEVPEDERPKDGLIPFVGSTTDTIKRTRNELPDLQQQVQELREKVGSSNDAPHSAVFVAFSSPAAAQRAINTVKFHAVVSKIAQDRFLAVKPKEAIWNNLTLTSTNRISRASLATPFVIAVILFWAIPIGFVGAVSNIRYLANNVSFLDFLNGLPDSVIGILSGFLPPLIISSLVSYVPKIFRYIAKLSGEPTLPQAELMTQSWYFVFQVIQVFLVTTISSGAAAVAAEIAQDPSKTPALLAKHLPQASNFYLAYILFQGTASAAKNLLNYSDLLEYLFYDRFIDKTPRAKYNRYTNLKNISWGSVYPKFTNLTIIAIAYSCIAPLILGFAAIGLFFFYLSYRYNLLYVLGPKIDSRGECHSKALQHLLTGVYLAELCLIGLFGAREAPGPTALMVVLLIVTALYHSLLNRILSSLDAHFGVNKEGETVPLLAAEEEGHEGGGTDSAEDAQSAQSKAAQCGLAWLPTSIAEPIARTTSSIITSTHDKVRGWLNDPSTRHDTDEEITYSHEEIEKAYLNPILTSKTPRLWLVKDEVGVSEGEVRELQGVGVHAGVEGAWWERDGDGKGKKVRLNWAKDDFAEVPIFKKAVQY